MCYYLTYMSWFWLLLLEYIKLIDKVQCTVILSMCLTFYLPTSQTHFSLFPPPLTCTPSCMYPLSHLPPLPSFCYHPPQNNYKKNGARWSVICTPTTFTHSSFLLCRLSPQNDGKKAIDLAKSEVSNDYISLVYSISHVCHNLAGASSFLIVLTIIAWLCMLITGH